MAIERVTDGAMELWTSATDLTNWTESIAGTSAVNRSTTKHGGTYAAELVIDVTNYCIIRQDITITAGADVEISIWYKLSEANKGLKFDLYSIDGGTDRYIQADGTWGTSTADIGLTNATTDWTNYTVSTTGHADHGTYRLVLRDLYVSTTVYVDDISLLEAEVEVSTVSIIVGEE